MTIATGDEALAADVAAVQANAASALTAAGTALANSATALSNSVAAQASATAAAALAAVALSVPALDVVSSVTSTDTVPIGQGGSTVAVTLQTLLNPETIDLLATANPAADTDTFPSGQGSNVLLRQTLAAVWSLMASHLPDYHQPVVELTANTNLDGSTHNNRLLICSQGITITPTGTMGSGFVCDVVNVSGSNVTLGAGITTSNAGNVLPTGKSARIVAATYSGGTVNFATLSAGSGGAAPATPGQVTGLTASGATASTMTLSWTAPSSGGTPTAYTVNYQVTGAGSWTSATTSASASPFTVTGLSASTSYEFEVIATNSGGSGTASSTVTASTGAATAAPGAPTNLAASEATSSTMELTWSAPGSGGTVSGYSAYFKLHSGSTWSLATAGLAASATSYTVTGLASGTSYDFYVAANSAGSGSTSSSTVTASTTTIAGPNAVTALAAGTVTNFTVPLSWTAPAIDGSHGAAATYTIQDPYQRLYELGDCGERDCDRLLHRDGPDRRAGIPVQRVRGERRWQRFRHHDNRHAGAGAGHLHLLGHGRLPERSGDAWHDGGDCHLHRQFVGRHGELRMVGNSGRSAGDVAGHDVVQRQSPGLRVLLGKHARVRRHLVRLDDLL